MRKIVVFSSLALAALSSSTAVADDAEALYRRGRAAAQRGDFEAACAAFTESMRLDAAPGTQLNLADCEEHRGHFVVALRHYREAAAGFKLGDERAQFALKREAALVKKMPHLELRLTSDVEVLVDGAPVSGSQPLALDPGKHTVIARASGRQDRSYTVELVEARTVNLDVFAGDPVTAPPPAPVVARPPAFSSSPGVEPSSGEAQRTFGWIAVGVGAAGIVAGSVTGLIAMNRVSTMNDNCTGSICRDQTGIDAARQGETFTTASTVAFVAGGVLLTAGTTLLLTAPRAKTTAQLAPVAGPNAAGASLVGRF